MSKKPAKSERGIDLPDWADDVTPADEVMRKFYAPTGTFRRGPIAPPGLSNPAELAESTAADDSQIRQKEMDAGVAEPPPPALTAPVEGSSRESPRATVPTAVRPPARPPITPAHTSPPPSQPTSTGGAPPAPVLPPAGSSDTFSPADASAESVTFDDFARKWRMYLYPGQLSVMRRLYELTHAVGTNECFIRYSEIAKATLMTRRNIINVVNSLVDRGFIERVEVKNDASAKGIRLRVYLNPRS